MPPGKSLQLFQPIMWWETQASRMRTGFALLASHLEWASRCLVETKGSKRSLFPLSLSSGHRLVLPSREFIYIYPVPRAKPLLTMRRFRAAVALVALALLWSSWLVGTTVGQSQTCYYPDGQETTALIPCNASLPATSCCKDSDVCLKNGLCFSPGLGSVVRRGCTDKMWNSTECAGICSSCELVAREQHRGEPALHLSS